MINLIRPAALGAALAATMAISAPAFAQASPVLGSWETTATTPIGELKSTFTFSGAAGSYAVDIKDQPMDGAPAGGDAPEQVISDLKIEGSAFSFKRVIQTPQGAIALTYSGTVNGESLAAKASSDFGDIDIAGTKAR